MHFVNAEEENTMASSHRNTDEIIQEITKEIESDFEVMIDRNGFNYNRFVMHLRYYMKRIEEKKQFIDDNRVLFQAVKKESPKIYECAKHIASMIDEQLGAQSTEDEILYLMIHIGRILKNNITV